MHINITHFTHKSFLDNLEHYAIYDTGMVFDNFMKTRSSLFRFMCCHMGPPLEPQSPFLSTSWRRWHTDSYSFGSESSASSRRTPARLPWSSHAETCTHTSLCQERKDNTPRDNCLIRHLGSVLYIISSWGTGKTKSTGFKSYSFESKHFLQIISVDGFITLLNDLSTRCDVNFVKPFISQSYLCVISQP